MPTRTRAGSDRELLRPPTLRDRYRRTGDLGAIRAAATDRVGRARTVAAPSGPIPKRRPADSSHGTRVGRAARGMADLTATPDELIAGFRELFPREYEIAFLTLATNGGPIGSLSWNVETR